MRTVHPVRLLRFKLLSIAWIALLLLQGQALAMVTAVTARQAQELIEARSGDPSFSIIDMRTPAEFEQGHIQGALLIDYYSSDFKQQLERLERGRTYLIYCRSGNRSGKALKIMEELGFTRVVHMKDGILEWRAQGLPLVQSR